MSEGVIVVLAPCICCQRLFGFNPFLVPSVEVDGVREPLCATCIALANPRRIANGLDPIVPRPGAYDPVSEEAWDE